MFPPDGLLTLGETKHDVEYHTTIIAPDPYASEDCFDVYSPDDLYLLTTSEEPSTMSTGDDDLSSGLNGRLRPRKSYVPNTQTPKIIRKSEGKISQDIPKSTSSPPKASPNKYDDLLNKSDFSPSPQFLCAYCDKKFASKQAVSKHARRMHLPALNQDIFIKCIFCSHSDGSSNNIVRHMVDSHPNQYFACLECHTRFPSTSELAEHKINVCEKLKLSYRNKLRQKLPSAKKNKNSLIADGKEDLHGNLKDFQDGHDFNGIVISCELKPSQVHNEDDIEDNITTNLILPPSKSLGNSAVLEKNAVIVLDDLQWNKRIPSNFSFHNTDADQILSRLGVVHRSPRTGESTRRDWLKTHDESTQKFERCFDTSFYSKVASNVQENLAKFLDGSFNFNPDPDNVIKTRKSKNSVVINTAEGFPILLSCEQFSRNAFDGYIPRPMAPKHKWKWDNLENDKSVVSASQIKRDTHTNNCIVTLVSGLDIWTQNRMRRKFEEKFGTGPIEKKTEKQKVIANELKEILESREIPTTSQIVKYKSKHMPSRERLDFPASLGLTPALPRYDLKPAVLSGEWVRPRCYVCCACGAQTTDARTLSAHIYSQHPNAQIQHYEIVGEQLLDSDILKHLYVPPSQMSNRTRPLRGIKECTKCNKSISLEDLHQHMLDCAGDTPAVRRRQCRYRPFGVRKRRPRLPDNTVRKKMRKVIRGRIQKGHLRPRQRIRTEVGDAETIRKMLADLPAKRHRVLVNPMNQLSRPRRNLDKEQMEIRKQRSTMKTTSLQTRTLTKKTNKLILKKRRIARSKNNEALKGDDTVSIKAAANDETNGYTSNNDDNDEDNLPLKPRRSDSVNKRISRSQSKSNLDGTKRESVRIKEQKLGTENADAAVNLPQNSNNDQSTIDSSSDRIDLKEGTFTTRQHGNSNNREGSNDHSGSNNHGGSNNREDDQGGGNGTNGNPNNHIPILNAPLKHSIASLTANSETHDKSVQFHHLFLVQQECNNINQSDQQPLFENEAVVTKLDKPPLHFRPKCEDYCALQKNKHNKPRKGLNDCIAMLKNKLTDPTPCHTSTHVSVKCGSDEPLELEPQLLSPNKAHEDSTMTIPPCKVTEIKVPKEHHGSVTNIENHQINAESPLKNVSCQEQPIVQQIQNETILHQPYHEIPPNHKPDLRLKRRTTRKSVAQQEPEITLNKKVPEIGYEFVVIPCNSNETLTENPSPPQRRSRTRSRRDNRHQEQSIVTIERDCNRQRSPSIPVQNTFPEMVKAPLVSSEKEPTIWSENVEVHPTKPIVIEQNPPEVYIENTLNQQSQMTNPENTVTQEAQDDFHQESDLSRNPAIEVFSESNHNVVPAAIPPAHASTNVESIYSLPLDLSGKIQTTKTPRASSDQVYMLCNYNYDGYETLDLSKSSDQSRHDTSMNSNDVVDLRVKPSQSTYERNSVDLSMSVHEDDNLPTDLSMRGNDNVSLDLTIQRRDEPIDYVQDFSSPYNPPLTENVRNSWTNKTWPEIENDRNQYPNNLLSAATTQYALETDENISMNITDPSVQNIDQSTDFYGNNYTEKLIETQMYTHRNPDLTVERESSNTVQIKKSVQRCVNDEPVPMHNHIYDSTFVPPFKMRRSSGNTAISELTDAIDASTPTCKETKVTNNFTQISNDSVATISSVGLRESTVFGNTAECAIAETHTHTVYALPSRVTSSANKLESTTPMLKFVNTETKYTNSCSTMPTNTVLRRPQRSVADTKTIYTSETNAVASMSYAGSNLQSASSTNHDYIAAPRKKSGENSYIASGQANTNININRLREEQQDQDSETARKIAMLPKELVEILGNMPADHRNQLLNVLPQYVSTSTSISISPSETPQTTTSALLNENTMTHVMPNKHKDVNNLSLSTSDEHIDNLPTVRALSNACPPTPKVMELPDLDKNHSGQFGQSGQLCQNFAKHPSHYDIKTSPSSKGSLNIEPDKFPLDSQRMPKIIEKERIIDLTMEDNIQMRTDVSMVTEKLTRSYAPPCEEKTSFGVTNPPKQKANNDQTASLRAVRIKAPSERQKDYQLMKRASVEQLTHPTNMNDLEDNEDYTKKTLIPFTQSSGAVNYIQVNKNDYEDLNIKPRPTTIPVNETKIDCFVNENIPSQNASNSTASTDKSIDILSKTNEDMLNIPKKNIPIQCSTPKQDSDTEKCKDTPDFCSDGVNVSSLDDDSEDDVSLAIIVKQKQQTLLQAALCDESNETKLQLRNKKRMERKQKPESAPIVDNSTELVIKNSTYLEHKDGPNTATNCAEKVDRKHIQQHSEVEPENLLDTDNMKDKECIGKMEINVRFEENKEAADILKKSHTTIIIEKKFNDYHVNETEKQNENKPVQVNDNEVANKGLEGLEVIKKNENDGNCVSGGDLQISSIHNKNLNRSALLNLECETKTKYTEIEQIENINASDLPTRRSIDQNVSPLRRSTRRGKSIFGDTDLSAHEDIISVDVSKEQKIPLTKKQLIFSKLLLDEEAHTKAIDIAKTEKSSYILKDSVNTHCVSEYDSGNEALLKKRKSTKRKVSPQAKQNCNKKKKSVPLQTDVNTSQNMINSPKPTMDNCSEIINVENSTMLGKNIETKPQFATTGNKSPDKPNTVQNIENVTVSDISTEKRKIDTDNESVEPKKTKLHIDVESPVPYVRRILDVSKEDDSAVKPKLNNSYETTGRVTTCYNMSIASRRTRSKSGAVKSSNAEVYDPYNIDLDDMNENSEPFIHTKITSSVTSKKNSRRSRVEASNEVEIEKPAQAIVDLPEYKQPKTTVSAEKNSKRNGKIETTYPQYEAAVKGHCSTDPVVVENSVVSDSDESSKSDVPLNKYLEEKVKRKAVLNNPKSLNDDIDVDYGNKKKRKLSVCNSVVEINPSESEEQLRSEQFMESFGFFSERKPRKSNLLATKKISETFNIIANESDDFYVRRKERTTKKASHKEHRKITENRSPIVAVNNDLEPQPSCSGMSFVRKLSADTKSDDDVDSITAKNILESEEVRKLENDVFNGLKAAANALSFNRKVMAYETHNVDNPVVEPTPEMSIASFSSPSTASGSYDHAEDFDVIEESDSSKDKKRITVKDKMYPDILDIDIFEDKFDKIKRKCRSQAAAAKQTQAVVEPSSRHKGRKKSDKMKGKKNQKKNYQSMVLTKGALKGYDGIKVSIPTSDINVSAIVASPENLPKRKKRTRSKKKREKRNSKSKKKRQTRPSGSSTETDANASANVAANPTANVSANANAGVNANANAGMNLGVNINANAGTNANPDAGTNANANAVANANPGANANPTANGGVDVYDFVENDDAHLFHYRPSTLMERYKPSGKDSTGEPSSTAVVVPAPAPPPPPPPPPLPPPPPPPPPPSEPVLFEEPAANPETPRDRDRDRDSASDVDDFVYMSDDYRCSDDETENSLLSCELGNIKSDSKKTSPLKRKDAVEKNAMVGKIFKHNAVRSEKKSTKGKEPAKSKANLDQLFDSLLETDSTSSVLKDDDCSTDNEAEYALTEARGSSKDSLSLKTHDHVDLKLSHDTMLKNNDNSSSRWYDLTKIVNYGASTSKQTVTSDELYDHNPSKKHSISSPKKYKKSPSEKYDESSIYGNPVPSCSHHGLIYNSNEKPAKERSPVMRVEEPFDYSTELAISAIFDDTGVARQRARRKCTVGKQNVLAETWSSESEPDGGPPRPSSADSVVGGAGRKKKGKKKDSHAAGRRNKQISFKKQDVESRVNSSNRNTSTSGASGSVVGGSRKGSEEVKERENAGKGSSSFAPLLPPPPPPPPPPAAPGAQPGPSSKPRPRSTAYYWSSEGDEEQEHQQQHGWIVGDSHKKLVTMLAHAKGRKRNGDDKRHLVE